VHDASVSSLQLALDNLSSPPVLAFALGAIAVLVRSDLRLPDPIHTWLASYLLLAIGLKGGHALRGSELADLAAPVAATIGAGCAVPALAYCASRALLRLGAVDAGALAAHYGSVSVATFTAAMVFAAQTGFAVEPYMTSLVALLEVPGILVALVLVSRHGGHADWRSAVHEVATGRSVLLLVGGLAIGLLAGDDSYQRVQPFFVDLFHGLLTLFLLDMGATAATQLARSRALRPRAIVFGVVAPIALGVLGVLLGAAVGLSVGGAGAFGAMTASASYIAAPAAIRTALPEANQGLTLGLALGVTFPVNLAFGIPLYLALAEAVAVRATA
jgi:hypothetical protein